jgi:hypothetical protein
VSSATISAAGWTRFANVTPWPAHSESASMSPSVPLEGKRRGVADDRFAPGRPRDFLALAGAAARRGAPRGLPGPGGLVWGTAAGAMWSAEI